MKLFQIVCFRVKLLFALLLRTSFSGFTALFFCFARFNTAKRKWFFVQIKPNAIRREKIIFEIYLYLSINSRLILRLTIISVRFFFSILLMLSLLIICFASIFDLTTAKLNKKSQCNLIDQIYSHYPRKFSR